jgi:hypothetical protein
MSERAESIADALDRLAELIHEGIDEGLGDRPRRTSETRLRRIEAELILLKVLVIYTLDRTLPAKTRAAEVLARLEQAIPKLLREEIESAKREMDTS